MTKHIFCKPVPNILLFELLEQISLKKEKYYIIDVNSFKKMLFHKLNEKFIETLKEYYQTSKQFYATREFTYKSFTNMVRQICKANQITYSSNIRYNESYYHIEYYIYF